MVIFHSRQSAALGLPWRGQWQRLMQLTEGVPLSRVGSSLSPRAVKSSDSQKRRRTWRQWFMRLVMLGLDSTVCRWSMMGTSFNRRGVVDSVVSEMLMS